MEVFADYVCQTKFIDDDWIHGPMETNNQSYMMPLTTSNMNTHKFNIMKDYSKHWINRHDSFDVTDVRWQEAKSEIQKPIV